MMISSRDSLRLTSMVLILEDCHQLNLNNTETGETL